MDNNAKAAIFAIVDRKSKDLRASWDAPFSWAALTRSLVEVATRIENQVDPVHVATVIEAAAMARRQSLKAPPHMIVISSVICAANTFVHVEPSVPGEKLGGMFDRYTEAVGYANRLRRETGWPIRDVADQEMVA